METIKMATGAALSNEQAFNQFVDDIYSARMETATNTAEISGTTTPAIGDSAQLSGDETYVAIWEYGVPNVELARREYKTAKGAVNFVLTAVYTGNGYATKNRPVKGASIETNTGKKLARVYVEDSGKIEVETFTADIQREIENWRWENRKIVERYTQKIGKELNEMDLENQNASIEQGGDSATTPVETFTLSGGDSAQIEGVSGNSDTVVVTGDSDTAESSGTTTELTPADIIPAFGVETLTGGVYVDVDATALDKYIAIFKQGGVFMKKGMALQMVALALIQKDALYAEKGYTSIIEFARVELNLSKQTTYRYLQTATKFYDVDALSAQFKIGDLVDDNGNFKHVYKFKALSIFADTETGKDFSPAALNDIAALDVDDIRKLIATGALSYDMTGKEIKDAVKPYRKNAKRENRQNAKVSGDSAQIDNGEISGTTTEITVGDNHSNHVNDTEMAPIENNTGAVEVSGESEIAQLRAQLAKMQKINDALKSKVADLDLANKLLKNENAQLRAENKDLSYTVFALNGVVKEAQAEIDELRRVNESQAKRVDELNAKTAELSATIDGITADYEDRLNEFYEENVQLHAQLNGDSNQLSGDILDTVEVGNINPAMQALYEKIKASKTGDNSQIDNGNSVKVSGDAATTELSGNVDSENHNA